MALVLWETWKNRNTMVLDGASPSVLAVLQQVLRVAKEWVEAGFLHVDMNPCLEQLLQLFCWGSREE